MVVGFLDSLPCRFGKVACVAEIADQVRVVESKAECFDGGRALMLSDPKQIEIGRDASEAECHVSWFETCYADGNDGRHDEPRAIRHVHGEPRDAEQRQGRRWRRRS